MTQEIKSTCCYCGTGCGVLIRVEGEQIAGVRGDPEHPANYGRLCTKGASLHLTHVPEARLQYPMRRNRATAAVERLHWDLALDEAASRFAEIIRAHGPDAVAFYVSGQLMTEDYYVFNKLAKGLIGTNNIDTNSRLCMSSAVAGYKQTLGVDAPPCAYEDIDHAQTILIAGANPAVAHPIVFRRIEDARAANPAMRIIVVDPRPSETAQMADLHLAIKPGTDVALFNGLLNVILNEGLHDEAFIAAHTEGFDALSAVVRKYPPAVAAEICGIRTADLLQAARWFAQSPASLSLYCQGLNQSAQGTQKNAALIHLHLATGLIGKPGCGPFSLTGQPNAMGGREVGGLSNLLPAHRDLANPAHRAEVARFWGVPFIAAQPGQTAVDLFSAIKRGQIKAVWIACTNPAQSLPNQSEVRAALRAAEYVVVQETYARTDTTAYADLLLPATGWGEKGGTVTNSERRITLVQPALPAPGEARHDWQIAVEFARRLGRQLGLLTAERLFSYETAEDIFNEHRESTRGRDLDITGLSYAKLMAEGPQQWPCPEGAARGLVRLYENGIFPTQSGRARFVEVRQAATADELNASAPISLLSGRMRDQWHGMSRTGLVSRLYNHEDEPRLLMNACDMRHRALQSGDIARVANARGEFLVRVEEQPELLKGRAWMPMHWGGQFMNSAGVNALSSPALDPDSKQPELKHAAVEVVHAGLAYPLLVLRACPDIAAALELQQRAQALFAIFPYASCTLYGSRHPIVVFRAAAVQACEQELLAQIDALFGMTQSLGLITYQDAQRAIDKRALSDNGCLVGVRLAGETAAGAWLKEAMAEASLDPALMRYALAPGAKAPVKTANKHIVCKCADVSDTQIKTLLARGLGLNDVQEHLGCGRFCGGCVPDLKHLVAEYEAAQTAAA